MQRLENPVRDYAWGSASDIPEFLGIAAEGGPVAELWIGAHPDSPSRVVREGKSESLAEVIAARPQAELGPGVASRFGSRLPFLLKVISAARPLSLQVHPDKQHAERAYAAQQQAPGAPRDYTDDNHKPELICALRDGFAGLCGFRAVPDSRHLFAALGVPELAEISDRLECADAAGGLRNVVTSVLTSDTDKAPLIAAVRQACERIAAEGGVWGPACAAYAVLAASYPADPGVLVALLLNYVELAAGEALFVGAGVPHCYLRGFGAELMASSDNVLRAGLTSKRVNVPELLRVLDFQPAEPTVLCPMASRVVGSGPEADEPGPVYPTPVDDFRLSRLDLSGQPIDLPDGRPQILLCIAGAIQLRDDSGSLLELSRGQSAYLSASDNGVSIAGRGTVLRASVSPATSSNPDDLALAKTGTPVPVRGLVFIGPKGAPVPDPCGHMIAVMATRLVQIAMNAQDDSALGRFWAEALGWNISSEEPGVTNLEPEGFVYPDPVAVCIDILRVPEPKTVKNRVHIDLATTSVDHQADLVARLQDLGATPADVGQGDVPWTVLADPEGNEFCVLEPRDIYRDTGPIAAVVVDCADPRAMARFWDEAMDWTLHEVTDHQAVLRSARGVGPYLEFLRTPDAKTVKNRTHLDLRPYPGDDQAAEVARLRALGATDIDVGQGDVSWTCLADPDGNEFDVLTPR